MNVTKYIEVAPGMPERLEELGYSKKTFCGQEINGVKVKSRSTFERAVKDGRMTESTYENYKEALGVYGTRYLVTGFKQPTTTPGHMMGNAPAMTVVDELKTSADREEKPEKKQASILDIYWGVNQVARSLYKLGAGALYGSDKKRAKKTVVNKIANLIDDASKILGVPKKKLLKNISKKI